MNVHLPAPRRRWAARLVNVAVVVVVLALAAATFVLSYTGVHVIALQAGVSPRLARVYPATFDAVLVIACVAAVMPRDARWWARSYAWLVIVIVVGVAGAADAAHAMNVALQHRTMEGVVAATPWVLALLGFSLMLTMLRHPRAQHGTGESQSGRASLHGPQQSAEQAVEQPADDSLAAHDENTGQPVAAIWQEAAHPAAVELESQHTPVPEATTEPDTTPAPDITPIEDSTAAPGEAAAAEEAAAPDATAAAAEPNGSDNPTGPAVSWQDYWETERQNGSGDQARPAAATEADADAPPFATAPFATIPRLNRVRSTPTPPEEDEG